MSEDKRSCTRFPVRDGMLATLSLPGSTGFHVLGQILDVSKRGLAFRYVNSRRAETDGLTELQLFWHEDIHALLDRVKCRVIYDCPLTHSPLCGSAFFRRCGVQFAKLTPGQLFTLESFIESQNIPTRNRSRPWSDLFSEQNR